MHRHLVKLLILAMVIAGCATAPKQPLPEPVARQMPRSAFALTVTPQVLSSTNVTFIWERNTETNIAAYRLHHGTASGSYSVHTNIGNVTNKTLSFAPATTVYAAATAISTLGLESGYSTEVAFTTPSATPPPPLPGVLTNASFTNTATITLPGGPAAASPYPSTIAVAGMAGTVTSVVVSMRFSHTWPDDVDIQLVGPQGHKTLLLSDAGGGDDAVGVNLAFSDMAAGFIGDGPKIVAGTFRPTNYENDAFPAPAPAGPYLVALSVFNGSIPNGTWALYCADDAANDAGKIEGWGLTIRTLATVTNTAPVVIAERMTAPGTPITIPVYLNDKESPGSLMIRVWSMNTALVPDTNLVLSGTGANRTLTVTPLAGQTGTAQIAVSVTDAGGLSASDTFTLVVR